MKDKLFEVKNLTLVYDKGRKAKALNNVSVDINKKQIVTIIGSSGSGKSTLLKTLNSLLKPNSGEIFYKGKNIKDINVNEYRKSIGMVFQHFNLFENMNVLDNMILAPMKVLGMSKQEATSKALDLLDRVNLKEFKDAYPATLSGGQKQRVAIVRSLMMNPEVMLFDEPTSALDPKMTNEVLKVMQDLANSGMSMVIVSHEMKFVKKVSDVVIYMEDGEIVEIGSPKQIFTSPTNEKTKKFVNLIQ